MPSQITNNDSDMDDDEDDGLSLDDLNFYAEDEVGELFDEEELKAANTPYDEKQSSDNHAFAGIQLPISINDIEENDEKTNKVDLVT